MTHNYDENQEKNSKKSRLLLRKIFSSDINVARLEQNSGSSVLSGLIEMYNLNEGAMKPIYMQSSCPMKLFPASGI